MALAAKVAAASQAARRPKNCPASSPASTTVAAQRMAAGRRTAQSFWPKAFIDPASIQKNNGGLSK